MKLMIQALNVAWRVDGAGRLQRTIGGMDT